MGKMQDNLTVNPIHTNGILNQFTGPAERKRSVELWVLPGNFIYDF